VKIALLGETRLCCSFYNVKIPLELRLDCRSCTAPDGSLYTAETYIKLFLIPSIKIAHLTYQGCSGAQHMCTQSRLRPALLWDDLHPMQCSKGS